MWATSVTSHGVPGRIAGMVGAKWAAMPHHPEREWKVHYETRDLTDSSILVVDLGDVVTLTAGGEEDSTEAKRHPYD